MEKKSSLSWEMIYGITLAVAAAILGVGDLMGGNADNTQIALINEKSAAYQWYQSKSIKETLLESQRDLMQSFLDVGIVQSDKVGLVNDQLIQLTKKVDKYGKEKREILLGSATVGKEHWVQDIKGKLGEVVGAEEYAAKIEAAGEAADRFDMSGLLLQLCLVMGAIGLLISEEKFKRSIYFVLLGLLVGGIFYFGKGFLMINMY
jgi:hypothetical protein